MKRLAQRVERLERTQPPVRGPDVILISAGRGDIRAALFRDGRSVVREPGDSSRAFASRVNDFFRINVLISNHGLQTARLAVAL
jgi:hypothetical protein